MIDATLGFLLKYQDDVDRLRGAAGEELLRQALAG